MALSKHMQRQASPAPPAVDTTGWTEEQIDRYLQELFPERPIVRDPMRDRLPDDSLIWLCLLTEALHDMALHFDLVHFRKFGTRIIEQDGYLRLQPIIDPMEKVGWKTYEQYKEAVDECLKPKARQLAGLLERASRLKKLLQRASLNS